MAGRSSSIDVFLSLHGQRKFAKELSASSAQLEAMGLKGARAMGMFAKKAEALKSFGKSWTRNVSLPVAAFGAVTTGMAVNFKRQMGLVATDAGGTAREVGHLEKSVLGLSRESQYGPQELAESLFHVESSGYRGAKAMKVLNASQKLATVGNSELEATTYAVVSATKAIYGASDEGLGKIKQTSAELNGIVAHGDMRLEELTSAMSTGLIPKAKSMGISLRGVGAAMDVMTSRGMPAQRAAYALGFTMQKLIPAGEKAEDAFASIGLGEETLVKAAKGPGGYVHTLEVLKGHLKSLPTEAKRTKVVEEMFGGGRMTGGLLIDLQNLGEMKKIYGELGKEVGIYQKHVEDAEGQPLVELKSAWSSVQASLVEIGNELVPEVVPAVKDLAKFGQKAADFFMKIPGPVKAIGVAALLLTGPIATGLGFFASGVGRSLIMLAKLGRMTQNVGIFSTALKSGKGLKGSSAIAFEGFGRSAALQTAKGLAYSLGPAVAAYGIANIVTSATSGDWKEAGFEAGGALAGGIAGFMLGGPMGAMLGVGLGSLGGELLSGLFSGGNKLSLERSEMGHLGEVTKEYTSALQGLPGASKAAATAAHHHAKAVSNEHQAEHNLARLLAKFGPETLPATRAQMKLDRAQRAVVRSARAERNAHRLSGNALKLFRMESVHQVASLKQLLPLEAKRIRHLNAEVNREPRNLALVKETVAAEKQQHKHKRELTEAYVQAEEKGGKPWSARLEKMTGLQAKFGSKGKVLVTRLNEQRDAFKELQEEGASVPGLYRKIAEEIRGTSRELGNFQAEEEGLGPARLHPKGPEGKHHPDPQRQRPRNHRPGASGGRGRNRNAQSGPRRLSAAVSGLGNALHVDITHNTTLVMPDGKVLAEETVKESRRAAHLQ